MEQNNNQALMKIEDINLPATREDFKVIGAQAESMVNKIADTVNNVSLSVAKISELKAHIHLECSRMEYMLDTLLLKAQRDIDLYKSSLPLLDKQFEKCQNRLDLLIGKTIDMISGDVSDESLARQEIMLSLIDNSNQMLNTLIGKLIPRL